ncbi:MAG: hypothetical protein MI724_01585 [Spirochaetales bacterium]|nr:hypothetical protein [Spirochaetales bacterium]
MAEKNIDPKKLSIVLPIMLLVLGLVFTVIAASMSGSAGFTFRLFTVGPFLLFLGVGTLIAPLEIESGGEGESETDSGNELDLIAIIKGAPKWKLAVWAGALIAGLALRDNVIVLVYSVIS